MAKDKKKGKQVRRQKLIQDFRMMDDTFGAKCFEDNVRATQLVLRIVMKNKDLCVKSVQVQKEIKNLQGRSVRMDVLAEDMEGSLYNIEMERSTQRAVPKRARYNGSILDANITAKREAYNKLKKTNIIFITEKDTLKGRLPVYHVSKRIEETDQPFGDDANIIYVNASCQDDTPLGRLMHDFCCEDPDEMYYGVLAERVRYLKGTKEGQGEMCEIMEKLEREARQEGIRIGEKRGEKRGERRGKRRGIKQGEMRVNNLYFRLLTEKRYDDMQKAVRDRSYRNRLFREYNL